MRLDVFLVKNNFIQSRNKALELIKNGFVKVDNKIITKSSFFTSQNNKIEILKDEIFVSRAGEKLNSYIVSNNLNFKNMNVLDIGSSKGGFTQVLLKYDALSVTCVDVGVNQLDVSLKNNAKVVLFESCDIRDFKSNKKFDFIVCDVSFISIINILDCIYSLAKSEVLLLFKPQFEVGIKAKRNKKGVVLQKDKIKDSLDSTLEIILQNGFIIKNIQNCALKGKEGNEEIFILIRK